LYGRLGFGPRLEMASAEVTAQTRRGQVDYQRERLRRSEVFTRRSVPGALWEKYEVV